MHDDTVATSSDVIWNRAAMDDGGPSPRAGDTALASLLLLHGLTMNGGLLNAVETLSPDQLDAAQAGYETFDLADAALLVAHVRGELARDDLGDDDLDELEREADSRYADIIDSDAVIIERFERRLAAAPEDFAPV